MEYFHYLFLSLRFIMSQPANFNGEIPRIDPDNAAMLLD